MNILNDVIKMNEEYKLKLIEMYEKGEITFEEIKEKLDNENKNKN